MASAPNLATAPAIPISVRCAAATEDICALEKATLKVAADFFVATQ